MKPDIDQRTKKRYCGYCASEYIMDFTEFMAHLSVCEKLLVKFLRRTSDGKDKKC